MTGTALHVGLLINPVAGIGGATALQGSDGPDIQHRAAALGGSGRGLDRARRVLAACAERVPEQLRWSTWGGAMGSDAFVGSPWAPAILGESSEPTNALATQTAAQHLRAAQVDVLLFVGGDGTARDLIGAGIGELLCLGVPAGVKMHSGVFATTPEAAAEIVVGLVQGAFVAAEWGEVRDLDEAARRDGQIRTERFGELRIPAAGGYVQRTKEAGRENEALAIEEITAELAETASGQIVIGPGGTCARIKTALGITQPTLLGVDVWHDGNTEGRNVDARWLADHAPAPDRLVVSFTPTQGFLFGRGNQQFTTGWLARLQRQQIQIVATRSKLKALAGAPLLIDTDSAAVNAQLTGLYAVTVGYRDELWYRVAADYRSARTADPGDPNVRTP
ncbi:MAG: NAD(+)/NADH kinase [Pseudomonadota bacterium]